jgi:acetyl esterase/lipase
VQNTIRKGAKPQEPWEVIHPLSPEDSVSMTALRSMVAGMKGKLEGTAARGPFDDIMGHVATPEGVTFEAGRVGDIPGWWAKPARSRKGAAILHLHGGWFNWGTAQAFRNLVGHIAIAAGSDAFIPELPARSGAPFSCGGERRGGLLPRAR